MRAVLISIVTLLEPSPAVAYTLRVLLAIALAYYAAYWLELESPGSAATTVLVLMNSSPGAIFSKSLWRFVGTFVGVVAAVILVAWFAQAPVLFVFGLALWIGLCTGVASLLRFFRGYAAVLAGYTVSLVAFGALEHPDTVFDLAMARLAVVTIGLLAIIVVFTVTVRGPDNKAVESRLWNLIAQTGRLIADALDRHDMTLLTTKRSQVAEALIALDQGLEFATVEDAGLSRFAGELRLAAAELLSAITGAFRLAALMPLLEKIRRSGTGRRGGGFQPHHPSDRTAGWGGGVRPCPRSHRQPRGDRRHGRTLP